MACTDADVDEVPAPGGTDTPTSVRAPNGAPMEDPPINVGTPAP